MKTEANYPVSMTGAHGSGKKTLRDNLCRHHHRWHAIDYKLLQLGRMVDEEGLHVFRERIWEQNQLIEAALNKGSKPISSRLGVLDVAIIATAMARFGRIEQTFIQNYLALLHEDLNTLIMPSTLIAVWAPQEVLQTRLEIRDRNKGIQPSRGTKKMNVLLKFLAEIFVERQYPNALIEEIVECYRSENRLLILDSGDHDAAAIFTKASGFLQYQGLVSSVPPVVET